jgi:ubiquinone/menaquinone biosynthesis C-methylase UbiE
MTIGDNLNAFVKKWFNRQTETAPEKAYNLWAFNYDNQPGNLMLDLDEKMFAGFLAETKIEYSVVADIGCGTGRHWRQIADKHPARLIGFDVSDGMLTMLQKKFSNAEVYRLTDNKLKVLADHSCDVIISTLAMAHIKNIEEALEEWNRVLKPGGEMIITDYHPETLERGGSRTFKVNNRLMAVKSYVHPVEKIKAIARQLGLMELRFSEKEIDESVKHYYEQQNAIAVYERFKGVPVIYGIHLKKEG